MKTKTKIKRYIKNNPFAVVVITIITLIGIVANINLLLHKPHIAIVEPAFAHSETEQLTIKEWVFTRLEQNLGTEEAVNGMMIITCESSWNPDIISRPNTNGTVDRGLWQINSIHKNISNTQALDYQYATDWAIKKRLRDGNWSAWTCARKLGIK